MERLDWNKLLCGERCRTSESANRSSFKIDDLLYDHRNEFDKDYDRIVYSSSVRRLQDKAQVFPLQENDFTRTRLTHSIEASALGRSLGYAIGEWLLKVKEEFHDYKQITQLSALLQVSALVHDLGNPPFGHYGEDIIRCWFRKWINECETTENLNEEQKRRYEAIRQLDDEQKNDLTNFEGNAQTLRIVSKLQLLNDEFGANFTYGTLATIIKYPWSSMDKRATNGKKIKFGYFFSEKELVKEIQEKTGLKDGIRHPATFLLEAADDMAYLLADIEDAVKKGIIPWEKEYTKIKAKLVAINPNMYEYIFKKLNDIYENNKIKGIPNNELIEIQNFKIYAQGLMFKNVVKAFKINYNEIMDGRYHGELLKNSGVCDLVEELKDLAKKYCFANKEVLTLELVGDNVINGLLNKFVDPLINCKTEPKPKEYTGKLYELISSNFKYVCLLDKNTGEKRKFTEVGVYERLLLVTDFISGMTDSYAVNLYKRLLGVKLP